MSLLTAYGQPASQRFLALGDSYTIGEGVAEDARWPVQLAELLRACGVALAEPQIIARTGWATDELAAAIEAAGPPGPFGLVSLLIGVNNQYRGRPADEYRVQFRALLGRAAGLAGGDAGRVLVLSIPDWGVTPFAADRDAAQIAAAIDAFNAIGRDEARQAGARYVDITAASRRAAADPALLADDGLHPAGAMYAEWAQLALPAALAALGLSQPAGPIPVTDLRHLAPLARRTIAELLAQQIGPAELAYDFYREWNGGWRVRVALSGARQGQLDFALLHTPRGGLLALPLPLPERWRTLSGLPASDGSRWTLDDQGQLVPFAPPGAE